MKEHRRSWWKRNFSRRALRRKHYYSEFWRLLLYKFWFRAFIIGLVLLVVFLGLFLPKIYQASPAGFKPVIKVSGLDLVQAWSLRRSAEKAMAAGRPEQAMQTWRAALANNLANADNYRTFLTQAQTVPDTHNLTELIIGSCFWLVRLSQTNMADVEFTARVLDHFRHNEMLLLLLDPLESRLSPAMETMYQKGLFRAGMVGEFARRFQSQTNRLQDAEISLYHAAYLAGWGPPEQRGEARKTLEAARQDPAKKLIAHRLCLMVGRGLRDLPLFETSYQALQEVHEINLPDQVNYWFVLAANGRKTEAARMARDHTTPPASASELDCLAKGLVEIDLRESAVEWLEHYAFQFSYPQKVWMTFAQILAAEKRWDALAELALRIRQRHEGAGWMIGYSCFLEGWAKAAQQARGLAEQAFGEVAEHEFGVPLLAVEMARGMILLGYPGAAEKVLAKVRPQLENRAEFWQTMFDLAMAQKQAGNLVEAAQKSFQLKPRELAAAHNYAASLLAAREKPDESLRLTSLLITNLPDNLAIKLTHAGALLQNARAPEASVLLQTIDTNQLSASAAATYYQSVFDASCQQKQWDNARRVAGKLDEQQLFPPEKAWLDKQKEQLAATVKPGS